ncbi:MAG: hypothetical protein O6705_10470, partial [Actinobacteria bacterium]|nr:hypothetical protein [Actinomycetota bacterium]
MRVSTLVVAGVFLLVVAACSGGGVEPTTSTMTTPLESGPAGLATTEPASAGEGQRHEFDRDTTIETTFVLRPGDSVVLLNGACLCFGPGGSADWQGTPTSTWSNEGNTQNLER